MPGLRELLDKYDIRPVHGRGQNFLASDEVLESVLRAAEVAPGEQVLEIGPGPGVLTEKLLGRGAFVVAVEIDGRLQKLLHDRFAGDRFVLVPGDAMERSTASLAARFPDPPAPYKVVANIPYGITSALLLKFLQEEPRPQSVTLTVQKEVAERVTAGPGEMSRLAVAVQSLGRPRRVRNVPSGAFSPPPKVDSAVLRVDVRRHDLLADWPEPEVSRFLDFVGRGFGSPRRTIGNLLSGEAGGKVESARILAVCGISPQARPATLSVEDWISLFVQFKTR
jgi:16S rRNA (adenine1518-N6/adenine1519-N6)-dimethyltransferase